MKKTFMLIVIVASALITACGNKSNNSETEDSFLTEEVEEEWVECENCNGRGYFTHTCSYCQGKGKLYNTYKSTGSCPTCVGTGIAPCNNCENMGYFTCSTCSGSGGLRCTACNGAGVRTFSYNGQVEYVKCGGCSGTGYCTCLSCNGIGHVKCRSCHGEGHIKCPTCGGTGGNYTTTVTEESGVCLNCNGSGKIKEECEECDGSGVVLAE